VRSPAVNRFTASGRGGIHIEQSLRARTDHGMDVADAVAAVFAGRLSRTYRPGPRWWRCGRELWYAIRGWWWRR
jgi:hypothetical protein